MRARLAVVSILGAVAALVLACDGNINLFGSPTQSQGAPVVKATPSPTPAPGSTPTPSLTPDPCAAPVTAVSLSGPVSVLVGDVFKVDVTPISASGPLEGPLDYCNRVRVPVVESMSANLRCSGACSGFGPQFLALAAGPFSVRIRVDTISTEFAGTVTR